MKNNRKKFQDKKQIARVKNKMGAKKAGRSLGSLAAAFLLAVLITGTSVGETGVLRVSAAARAENGAGALQQVGETVLPLSRLPLTEDGNGVRLDFIVNQGNVSKYDGAVLTGSFSDNNGDISKKRIVIDGTTVNLTIRDVTIDRSAWYATTAAIELVNGAALNLTLEGDNVLKGSLGGAGIGVGEGCTLTVTSKSTGTLTAAFTAARRESAPTVRGPIRILPLPCPRPSEPSS